MKFRNNNQMTEFFLRQYVHYIQTFSISDIAGHGV